MKPNRARKIKSLALSLAKYLKSQDILFTQQDLKIEVYRGYTIRKMIYRFLKYSDILNEKLLLNNIIIFCNVFEPIGANVILKLICSVKEYEVVKSCMLFLSSYPFKDDVKTNELMNNILNDIKIRYNINNSISTN